MLAYKKYTCKYKAQDGIALIMLHGFLCGGDLFAPNIKTLSKSILSKSINIITIDLPGFAKSNLVTTPNSIYEIALQVIQTIKQLKISRYHLLGHSMGGMVALQMALLDSHKIKKLILYATNSSGNLPERFESFDKTKEKFIKNGIAATRYNCCKTWFQKGDKDKYFKNCLECGGEISIKNIINALEAMKSFDLDEQINKINNDTLIIAAAKDRTYAPHRLQKLHQKIHNSKFIIFENCYHNAHLEKQNSFNKTIIDFFSKSLL